MYRAYLASAHKVFQSVRPIGGLGDVLGLTAGERAPQSTGAVCRVVRFRDGPSGGTDFVIERAREIVAVYE